MHKAGFVNILGNPNVGKSTLMNALVGERMSIINRKPQTTRHRIIGIANADDYQIVLSDTPGRVRDPQYRLHQAMNSAIAQSFEDADIILYMTTIDTYGHDNPGDWVDLSKAEVPVFAVVNKCDSATDEQVETARTYMESSDKWEAVFLISAKTGAGLDTLHRAIVDALPEHPPYFPKDQLTDRPERFFVTEIIRDNILTLFHQEVPYSCEVIVEDFKESTDSKGPITRIRAVVYANRKSQKAILIGKGGEAIKRLGTRSRKDIEAFLDARVFLDLHIKVRENWRDDQRSLNHFGY